MMGITSRTIEKDEFLSEEVRKYACFYDKSDKGYKERDRVRNAWKAVDESLGYEEGIYIMFIYFSS